MFNNICFECSWVIIPMLIISWLLGWLFWWLFNRSKYQARIDELEEQVTSWKNKSNQFEGDLTSANYEKEKMSKDLASYRSKNADLDIQLRACKEQVAAATEKTLAAAPPSAKDESSVLYKPTDLKIVEGIGPKIEKLLQKAGINNWEQLAQTSVDRLKEILSDAGDRYRMHDPSTWSKQATMAQLGKWQELKDYQDELKGGHA